MNWEAGIKILKPGVSWWWWENWQICNFIFPSGSDHWKLIFACQWYRFSKASVAIQVSRAHYKLHSLLKVIITNYWGSLKGSLHIIKSPKSVHYKLLSLLKGLVTNYSVHLKCLLLSLPKRLIKNYWISLKGSLLITESP